MISAFGQIAAYRVLDIEALITEFSRFNLMSVWLERMHSFHLKLESISIVKRSVSVYKERYKG